MNAEELADCGVFALIVPVGVHRLDGSIDHDFVLLHLASVQDLGKAVCGADATTHRVPDGPISPSTLECSLCAMEADLEGML